MSPEIHIRPETTGDFQAISDLTRAAFAASEFGHNGEADLIEQLRLHSHVSLSLVAELADEIRGHILFTPVTISQENQVESTGGLSLPINGWGLGPMSVEPRSQKQGIGKRLIEQSLHLADDQDIPFIVVLGHPDYYPRYGFESALNHGVSHGFAGIPQDVFFIRFHRSLQTKFDQGCLRYNDEFGPQTFESV